MVEVIHQWPRLKYPEMALLKMVGVTAVLFLAGLLPWVDNYAHLFGFIFGFLLSYALLPFVTLGGGGGGSVVGEQFDRRVSCIILSGLRNTLRVPQKRLSWVANHATLDDPFRDSPFNLNS